MDAPLVCHFNERKRFAEGEQPFGSRWRIHKAPGGFPPDEKFGDGSPNKGYMMIFSEEDVNQFLNRDMRHKNIGQTVRPIQTQRRCSWSVRYWRFEMVVNGRTNS